MASEDSTRGFGDTMSGIHAAQMLADLKAGLSERELMNKYKLSPKRLQKLVEVLVKKNSKLHDELYRKSSVYRNITEYLASRRSKRIRVPVAIRVYDKAESQRGFLRDLSTNGIRVAGIRSEVGQSKVLLMPLEEVAESEPLEFTAVCRWSKEKGINKKYPVSGFEIIEMSEDSRTRFLELIESLRFHDEGDEATIRTISQRTELLASVSGVRSLGGARVFSGSIHNIDILDLMQLLLLTGTKTVVHVQSPEGESGTAFLDSGRVVHAVQGNLTGREAFFACLNFPGGRFSTEELETPSARTIEEPGDFLILEAARKRDELLYQRGLCPEEDLEPALNDHDSMGHSW
jgi:hypothetical protein